MPHERKTAATKAWSRADRALVSYIIKNVKVVFVTCSLSSHDVLADRFQPNVLFVDEAGQATEPDMVIPMFSFHKSLQAVFLSGDVKQLRPVVLNKGSNEYRSQLILSPFARLLQRGYHESTLLRYTYRSRPVHVDWLSRTFCDGQLESRSRVWLQEDLVKTWFANHFGQQAPFSTRLAFDISRYASNELYRESTSQYNPVEAEMIRQTCFSLKRAGLFDNDLLVLSPYLGQVHHLKMLFSEFEILSKIRIKNFDSIKVVRHQ